MKLNPYNALIYTLLGIAAAIFTIVGLYLSQR